MKTCKACEKEIEGRVDKLFCSDNCKSAYHYQHNKTKQDSMFIRVDKQLKLNRRILKQYHKESQSTVSREVLIKEGFNPTYFTHYWRSEAGEVHLFCYEYGFFQREEDGIKKFILVHWQPHMDS
jgi:hypothetical protein